MSSPEKYKLYIIEDDPAISEGLKTLALQWGFEVRTAVDFRRILEEFTEFKPHLVLMDIGLPFFNGYWWCTEIRKTSGVPVIFISSASDNMNIVMAMNMGGDDFIAKPFDNDVLMAKINSLLRRCYDLETLVPEISCRGVVLNQGDNTISFGGEKIDLTKNEYRILSCLMENRGRVVSREKLMEALWQTDSFIDENTLTVNMGRLRKKLETCGIEDFITTKHGVGYVIV